MIKKYAVVYYTLLLVLVMTMTLSSPFLDLERVWAQILYSPHDTTIISAVDGNYNQVQNGGSTASRIIIFKVIAAQGTYPLEGFQCNLDGVGFSRCGHVVTIIKSVIEPTKGTYDISGFPCNLDGVGFSSCATSNPDTITYNNLAAGQHTFQVRAVDIQGDIDRYPATFSWTVLTPTQEIQNIVTTIDDMNLPSSITTRLEAPLYSAIRLLDIHQDTAACKSLDSFLQIVNADVARNPIIQQQSNELIQQATAIQQAFGCHSSHLQPSSPSPYDTFNGNGMIGPLAGSTLPG